MHYELFFSRSLPNPMKLSRCRSRTALGGVVNHCREERCLDSVVLGRRKPGDGVLIHTESSVLRRGTPQFGLRRWYWNANIDTYSTHPARHSRQENTGEERDTDERKRRWFASHTNIERP